MLVREVVLKPHLGMVYADSDLIAPDGTLHNPDFKPDFDYTLLLAQNYICHPCLYQLNKVRQIGGFKPGFEGSQDYDLSLRYIEAVGAGSVGHVPLVLYHWRQAATSVSSDIANKPYAIEAAAKAVLAHLTRKGVTAFAGPHPAIPSHHIVRYLPPDSAPRVCIIILTRTNRKQLEMCVGSILKNTLYSNYSVIIRQTGADAGVTETAARLVKAEPKRVRHVRGGADLPGTPFFNYALLNNAVAGSALAADAEVLVFLNDDTAILEGAWLSDMVGQALQPDTGAVGAKLIYPGGTVQHNGVGIDPYAPAGEVALHLYRGQPHSALGPAGRAAIAHECVAVTGACMAIRHSLFGEVGGFDAAKFPLDYNDTDLCLRLLCLGKRNVVLSHIVLQHNEGATKKARPELMSRSGMLASESALRDSEAFRAILGSDKLTFHANPNLMHEPSQAKLRNAPYRPWMSGAPLPATLLIGGDREDVQRVYVNGERPMSAVFDGPYLNMLEPPAPQVGLVDMRDKKTFEELLNGLGITHITLRRLGGGSSEALGMLTAMANDGMPVDYQPASFESVCPRLTCTNSLGPCNHEWKQGANGCQVCVDRDGSEHGYVAVASYRNDWNRFAAALTAASETVVQTDEAAK
jgi:GT2 family glycosyltransferase